MIESPNNLSPAGQRRRQEILRLAIRDATNRRYARIERRLGVGIVAAICLTGTLILRHGPPGLNRSHEIAKVAPNQSTPDRPAAVVEERIQIVRSDPNILERLSIKPEPPRWRVIGDDELLATLQAAGRPAGLVEINGKMRVVFQ